MAKFKIKIAIEKLFSQENVFFIFIPGDRQSAPEGDRKQWDT